MMTANCDCTGRTESVQLRAPLGIQGNYLCPHHSNYTPIQLTEGRGCALIGGDSTKHA
jgi:hypothetical protein